MASIVGHIDEFDSTKEDFESYCERLEQFFAANSVAGDKQRAVFLSVVGPSTYGLLKSLLAPAKPSDKTFDELKKSLQDHLSPKPLVIPERFKFYRRYQKEGESVAAYSAELRRLATHCEFGDFLNDALRDRLVCGLRSEVMQRKLLSEKAADLTFVKAIDIALSMEMASQNTRELKQDSPSSAPSGAVHKVGADDKRKSSNPGQGGARPKTQNNEKQKPCYRCNGRGHSSNDCRYKEYKCNFCGKQGHLQQACHTKARGGQPQQKQKSAKYVSEFVPNLPVIDDDDDLGIYMVNAVTSYQRTCMNVSYHTFP